MVHSTVQYSMVSCMLTLTPKYPSSTLIGVGVDSAAPMTTTSTTSAAATTTAATAAAAAAAAAACVCVSVQYLAS
jgi:hypothetical protein